MSFMLFILKKQVTTESTPTLNLMTRRSVTTVSAIQPRSQSTNHILKHQEDSEELDENYGH